MKVFNNYILHPVGINSLTVGSGYTSYLAPNNGMAIQGNVGISTYSPAGLFEVYSEPSHMFYVSPSMVGINTIIPYFTLNETLSVYQPNTNLGFTVAHFQSNQNQYSQTVITNFSQGNYASADFTAQSDAATETSNYINIGINNSKYNYFGNFGTNLDAYVVSSGANLYIGNVTSLTNYNLYFVTGGIYFTSYTRATITGFGSFGIGITNPTAFLHIDNPDINSPTIKLEPSPLVLSRQAGTIEYDGYVFAGTASTSRGIIPTQSYAYVRSPYVLSNSVGYQKLFNVSGNGALGVAQSTMYSFECLFYITGMNAGSGNAGFQINAGGSAGIGTVLMSLYGLDNTTPSTAAALSGITTTLVGTGATVVTAATGTGLFARASGIFYVLSSGTIIPSVKLLANTATATVMPGSFWRSWPIGLGTSSYVGDWS